MPLSGASTPDENSGRKVNAFMLSDGRADRTLEKEDNDPKRTQFCRYLYHRHGFPARRTREDPTAPAEPDHGAFRTRRARPAELHASQTQFYILGDQCHAKNIQNGIPRRRLHGACTQTQVRQKQLYLRHPLSPQRLCHLCHQQESGNGEKALSRTTENRAEPKRRARRAQDLPFVFRLLFRERPRPISPTSTATTNI